MVSKKFLMNSAGIISVLLIIYLTSLVSFIFQPIITIFHLLLVPIVLAGFFYYLLRPVVFYMDKYKLKRTLSVLLIYFLITLIMTILILAVWPILQTQLQEFITNIPQLIEGLRNQVNELQNSKLFSTMGSSEMNLSDKLSEYANRGFSLATNYANGVFAFISKFIVVIGTFPIILFFLLREGEKTPEQILRFIPNSYQSDARKSLGKMDSVLSEYISSRMLSTLLLGIMTLIGFLIVGVPYALLLTIVLCILSFIPLIGTFIGAVPPLIVAFIESPQMALWILVVVLITQQIQDNILTPMILGNKLDIHPCTTIIILLIAGNFAGILGMILVIPLYLILKIILLQLYELFLAKDVEEIMEK